MTGRIISGSRWRLAVRTIRICIGTQERACAHFAKEFKRRYINYHTERVPIVRVRGNGVRV